MKYLGKLAILFALVFLTTGCRKNADSQQYATGDAVTVVRDLPEGGVAQVQDTGDAVSEMAADTVGEDVSDDVNDDVNDDLQSDVREDFGNAIQPASKVTSAAGKDDANVARWQRTWGTVTFQGQPVAQAEVVFYRKSSPFNRIAHTNDQGQFECKTHLGKGLPTGKYQVVVRPIFIDPVLKGNWDPNEPLPKMTRQDIPRKYHDRKTSPLWYTVVQGDNAMNIVLAWAEEEEEKQ